MVEPKGRGRPKKPPLAAAQVLAWADAYKARMGLWPKAQSGLIEGSGLETWLAVDLALRRGWRGLPGGDSLPGLLARERGAPERA